MSKTYLVLNETEARVLSLNSPRGLAVTSVFDGTAHRLTVQSAPSVRVEEILIAWAPSARSVAQPDAPPHRTCAAGVLDARSAGSAPGPRRSRPPEESGADDQG